MLVRRLAISAILIPLVVLVFYFDAKAGDGAPLLLVLCVLLAIGSVWEMVAMLRFRSFEPSFLLSALCTVAVVAAGWEGKLGPVPNIGVTTDGLGPVMIVYSLSVLLLFLKGAIRYREPGKSMETLGAELLIVSYVGVLLSVTAQLRWVAGPGAGYLALGSLLMAAKSGDVGAYTLGRLFGRRKMVPRLSPGKTWMGGVGALGGAALGAWAWLQVATRLFNDAWQPPHWYWAVLYGVVIGMAGLIGDLCESLIKRDTGQKDSARLMPGFGGLLDLLDSILYAGPIAYVLWLTLPLKAW